MVMRSTAGALRVAFVHEWLTSYGGAERVLEAMLELYPEAVIHTLVHKPEAIAHSPLSRAHVKTSFVDRLPLAHKHWRVYLPLMPWAIEQLDLRGYDLVLSFSHSLSHGVLVRHDRLHLCYMYSPARFAWHQHQDYLDMFGLRRGPRAAAIRLFLHYFRLWDHAAAGRVDRFLAVSQSTAQAIWRAYRRRAQVIYPPVDMQRFRPIEPRGDHYVTLTRLVPHKHVDLIIRACRRLGRPLVVIGDGPERGRLASMAAGGIRLVGWQSEDEISRLLGSARGFIHAAEEDFGIAPVEAQAAGCPVIGYAVGGLRESVKDGETGVLFEERSTTALEAALLRFESIESSLDRASIRRSVERFSKQAFQAAMRAAIDQANQDFGRA
jgi:glycosyltransferase involved in cell wall biosynthesis